MDAELAYLFRHALIRDAAYELQPPSDRAALHALALQVIEAAHGGPPPNQTYDGFRPHALDALSAELAAHARHARETNPDLAGRYQLYLWRGARHALRAYRVAAAVAMLIELRGATRPGELMHVAAAFLAGYALLIEGNLNAAEVHVRAACEAAGSDPEFALYAVRAKVQLVHLLARMGRPAEADAPAADLLSATGLDAATHVSVLSALAQARRARGDHAGALALLQQALPIAQAGCPPVRVCEVKGYLAGLLNMAGRRDEAAAMLQDAIEIAQSIGDARQETVQRSNLATLRRGEGDDAAALREYDLALALARRVGDRFMQATIIGNRANLYPVENVDQAQADYREALDVSIEVGDRRKQAHWIGSIGTAEFSRGNHEAAVALYREALAITRETSDVWLEGAWQAAIALPLIHMGDIAGAAQAFARAQLLLANLDNALLAERREKVLVECREAGVDPAAILPA